MKLPETKKLSSRSFTVYIRSRGAYWEQWNYYGRFWVAEDKVFLPSYRLEYTEGWAYDAMLVYLKAKGFIIEEEPIKPQPIQRGWLIRKRGFIQK